MSKCIIFDFDDTIMPTDAIGILRDKGRWKDAVSALSTVKPYSEFLELYNHLVQQRYSICILSHSVSYYLLEMCKLIGIEIDKIVAYHDIKPRLKPDPYGVLQIKKSVICDSYYGIGNDEKDAECYAAAGILSIGAAWSNAFIPSKSWDVIVHSTSEAIFAIESESNSFNDV